MVIGDREPGKSDREGDAAAILAVCVPVVVMTGLGLWGLDRDGMWRDEGVTFQVARRSVPEILRLVQGVDAVHALYYLLMHAVLAVHPGEIALRLPSVLGAAAAAGLIAALGVRLARPRVGLWAGLLYAVTPLVGHYAQEGRSYALVTAGAAGATLLLVRRVWWAYGVVLSVTCLLHELAAPLVCAHAVTLGVGRAPRRVWAAWGCAVAAAGVALLPLLLVSRAQAGQVGWLPVPGWGSAERLLREFAAGPSGVVFGACVLLMVAGLGSGRVAGVALPLLAVPPGLLIAVSQVRPMYDDRYVLYALAGAPLLVAAGADRLAGLVCRVWPYGDRPSRRPDPCDGHPATADRSRSLPRLPWPAPSPSPSPSSTTSPSTARTAPRPTVPTTSPPPPPTPPGICAPATRCCSCRRSGGGRCSPIRRGSGRRGTSRCGSRGRGRGRSTAVRSGPANCGAGLPRWTGCGSSPSRTR